LPGDIKKAVEVSFDHTVPLLFGHPGHQAILAYAGIIYQHLDMFFGIGFYPAAKHLFDLFTIGHIKGYQFAVAAGFPDNVKRCFSVNNITFEINEHMVTRGSQPYANGPANSP